MNVVRAWKDPEYRAGLSARDRDGLPANPAGTVELDEQDLALLAGGTSSVPCGITVPITTIAGCFTIGHSVCNGTCGAFGTHGCC